MKVMIEPSPLLAVENLTIGYTTHGQTVEAVSNVDLTVYAGERIAIVGESGSGKTSLSLALAGFISAPNAALSHTSFTFRGEFLDRTEIHRMPRRTDGLSMVFQDAMTSLDPVWTIGNQITNVIKTEARRAGRSLRTTDVADEARSLLARVGLTETRRMMKARPFELSGGMRQRVMLAIAISGRPQLLIADEPTSALDASLSREMMELMVELTEASDTALILVSHDISLCREYAERILVMRRGVVVDDVAAGAILEEATNPYTLGLLNCVPTLASVNLHRLPTLEDAVHVHNPPGGKVAL